jgi:MoxR-like ATPase
MLGSVDEVAAALARAGYLPSREVATAVFLADRLEKPILVEGPAGVGKTELARAFAEATARPLVRLQCYEGLDEARALYEWEYGKQLLYAQLLSGRVGEAVRGAASLAEAADRIAAEGEVFFSERFLLPRPILRAIRAESPVLLLVDELDKADPELEAFLLEVLSEWTVTVPELGTLRARSIPRELSDALRRRCLHLHVDLPDRARELEIVRARVPGAAEALARAVVAAVAKLRTLDLRKPPSVSETLDWVRALALLGAGTLDAALLDQTLGLVLKHEADLARARERRADVLAAARAG